MSETKLTDREDVRELVRKRYGEAALRVMNHQPTSCCGEEASGETCCGSDLSTGSCCSDGSDPITTNLYSDKDASEIPKAALLASLGCGNPTALAQLKEGEIVLDLGSGGGIDVLLSAKRVGPTGFAYGLDMTDEMLALAEQNKAESGATNVQFLKGHIEDIPLPDNSVDVIISNCVINLSADKSQVIREAFRVLKPGGRFAVSDVVVDGEIPDAVRKDMEAYVGCVAGAMERGEYADKLGNAGFADITIEPTRRYTFAHLESSTIASEAVEKLSDTERRDLDGRIMGAFIRATKPAVKIRKVEVFDPVMCCSTGVCGPSVDPKLLTASRDLAWLSRQPGVTVQRFNLALEPQAFVANEIVSYELQADSEVPPLVVIDGQIAFQGEYPSRTELCRFLNIDPPKDPRSLNVVPS